MKLRVAYNSSIGSKKENEGRVNEDTIIVNEEKNYFILADGMGGHNAADTASKMAGSLMAWELEAIASMLQEDTLKALENAATFTNGMVTTLAKNTTLLKSIYQEIAEANIMTKEHFDGRKQYLEGALNKINSVLDHSEILDYPKNMGTTLDACIINNNIAYIAHVGDGAIYKIDAKGYIKKLTEEHSKYSDTDAESLENYIGKGYDIRIDKVTTRLLPDETIFMATDGVTKNMYEEEIGFALKDFDAAEGIIQKIVEEPMWAAIHYASKKGVSVKEAREKLGGRDNASFIIIRRD